VVWKGVVGGGTAPFTLEFRKENPRWHDFFAFRIGLPFRADAIGDADPSFFVAIAVIDAGFIVFTWISCLNATEGKAGFIRAATAARLFTVALPFRAVCRGRYLVFHEWDVLSIVDIRKSEGVGKGGVIVPWKGVRRGRGSTGGIAIAYKSNRVGDARVVWGGWRRAVCQGDKKK